MYTWTPGYKIPGPWAARSASSVADVWLPLDRPAGEGGLACRKTASWLPPESVV